MKSDTELINSLSPSAMDQIMLYLAFSKRHKNKPTAIIAKTIKGKGIKFMENNNDWHHNRLTEKLFKDAMEEI